MAWFFTRERPSTAWARTAPSAPARRRSGAAAVAALALVAMAPPPLLAAPTDPAAVEVRFAPEKDYGPFVFADSTGAVRGLSVDLLQLVQQHAALRVTWLPAASLAEQLVAVREGRADLLSSLRPTPERATFLAFSQPYVSVPALLVRRAAGGPTPSVGGLQHLAGQPVAVGKDYAVEGFVRERFPQVGWVAVPDDVAALKGVAQGRYAAAVVDAASAAFIQRELRLRRLETVGPVGFEYRLSFAVPKHRQDLLDRVDAGIRAITAAERTAIVARWLAPLGETHASTSALGGAAAQWGLALIGLSALAGVGLALRPAGAAGSPENKT
ncbi:transporter substrate-binding domain-containing protein [Pseudaquabacterium pictum]|uniref:transporter substrate-binding domain-containing protein n=1 Tax=Pseudaquabacterium pictum TaxID=2315236 RepID=UPI0013967DAA|nr:transporter substrate-binding domain-containing protein [Rubrivivax pictus]